MTKVDEKAPVPPVDAAARARLAEALDRDERWSLRLEMIGAAEEACEPARSTWCR